jgi:hypothetical protein
MKQILWFVIFVTLGVQADIYRSIDREGNVTFTDEPDTKAELIELEESMTYEALPIPVAVPVENVTSPSETAKKPKYNINIMSPEQNQSLWEGGGIFTATVSVQPELNTNRADQLQFKLDGKAVSGPQSELSHAFQNIERGSHILAVSIVDKNGKVLKTSKSILFHMHRNSVAN